MTVSYWINLGVRYICVAPFNLQHQSIMECVAPYCAIQLRVEVAPDL